MSHFDCCKFWIKLSSLSVRHLRIVEAMELTSYVVEVISNIMTSLINFKKSTDSKVKLVKYTGRQRDKRTGRQKCNLINLTFHFKETRLKIATLMRHTPWNYNLTKQDIISIMNTEAN
jgi:hypothetical protein